MGDSSWFRLAESSPNRRKFAPLTLGWTGLPAPPLWVRHSAEADKCLLRRRAPLEKSVADAMKLVWCVGVTAVLRQRPAMAVFELTPNPPPPVVPPNAPPVPPPPQGFSGEPSRGRKQGMRTLNSLRNFSYVGCTWDVNFREGLNVIGGHIWLVHELV